MIYIFFILLPLYKSKYGANFKAKLNISPAPIYGRIYFSTSYTKKKPHEKSFMPF